MSAYRMYVEMIRIRFLMMLAYRVNYYSGIIIYAINIGAYYFLWMAIYGQQESLGGLSPTQMTTYIAVAWMARAFYFNNIDREMALEIKEGRVAIELIRPYHYLMMKMMQALGEGIFRFSFFSIPGMVVVSFIFPIVLPMEASTFALYLLSLTLAFVINTQINLITGVLTFFFFNNDGLMQTKRVVVDLFSGLLIPIALYPEWAIKILEYLPFQAIAYLPAMIFTGGVSGNEIYQALFLQLFWVVVLIVPIQLLWKKAKQSMIIQGG
ncbi:ABC transporter permease [Caldalkalibacillus salinus]|uniref:ABC transporter permease n=1 Tax=Caldalkalibacillus salinus TaxID=2803787 RepID=UPI0019212DAE|nr:ABC-2 family transporter protein [Caldalkalibacillus salinus]